MPRVKTQKMCLVQNDESGEKCDRDATTRGLCSSHYSIARRLVEDGDTTWEQLEAKGRAKKVSVMRGATDFFLGGGTTKAKKKEG